MDSENARFELSDSWTGIYAIHEPWAYEPSRVCSHPLPPQGGAAVSPSSPYDKVWFAGLGASSCLDGTLFLLLQPWSRGDVFWQRTGKVVRWSGQVIRRVLYSACSNVTYRICQF